MWSPSDRDVPALAQEPAVHTDERAQLAELQREVRELRRANAILRKALAFFALADVYGSTPIAAPWRSK